MTFLEAAIEILRTTEEPLHFNEIARLAVERKLLSHVGRDPEAAMRSCLNSAVRSKAHDGLVMRSKAGHFRLRPGVDVPELPDPPSSADPPGRRHRLGSRRGGARERGEKASKSKKKTRKTSTRTKKKVSRRSTRARASEDEVETEVEAEAEAEAEAEVQAEVAPQDPVGEGEEEEEGAASESSATEVRATTRKTRRTRKTESSEAQTQLELDASASRTVVPMAKLDPSKVRFRGPEGSGLEGETDIALVMANAMSRLVDERPELREELEAMQKGQPPAPEVIEVSRKKRRDDERNSREDDRGGREDERGGRRRRRRRRRSRRVEWADSGSQRAAARGDELLDRVAKVLTDAGPRSLHVRQIAENLANQGILGGEISEIERAVTAAMLLDVHSRGDASRFAIRGDARYQLRGNRLPEKAAVAEQAMRASVGELERETKAQLLLWIQSLGARSLESLVRIWLTREGFNLIATLPPARGLGKLVVEDPDPEEDEGRTLVLIVPRKTNLEPKLWDGEAERNGCANTLVFSMSDASEASHADARIIQAQGFAAWLVRNGVGVRSLNIRVPVLDADLIESIGGLDT